MADKKKTKKEEEKKVDLIKIVKENYKRFKIAA